MKGLLTGIGAGAAFSAAALIPLPVLALGGVLLLAANAAPEPAPEPEEPVLTDAELQELEMYASVIDNAPDAEARQALIEEFYPGSSLV